MSRMHTLDAAAVLKGLEARTLITKGTDYERRTNQEILPKMPKYDDVFFAGRGNFYPADI